jgi:lysozyme
MAYGLFRAAAVLAGAGLLGIAGWSAATGWHPSTGRYPLQGIDLGESPGPVEWGIVRARGADFAYLVATSGADRRDPAFEANWAAVPEAGLRRGAVHLYSLCQPGIAQANAFNAFVPRTADALPVAVDVRYRDDCTARPDRADLVRDLATFVRMVETHIRKPVLLRVTRGVEADYRLSAAIDRPVWAVADFLSPDYAARPWRMWRASDIRRIDGIEGPVNWNVVAP